MNEFDEGGVATVTAEPTDLPPRRRRDSDSGIGSLDEPSPVEIKGGVSLIKVVKLLNERIKNGDVKRVAIFSHPCPDPDAIASMMGLAWMLRKAYDVEVDCFYDGVVSHPQNQRLVNLLDPGLKLLNEYKSSEYQFNAVVDTIPIHAAMPVISTDESTGVKTYPVIDLVIDHHRELPNGGFRGVCLNLKTGSASAAVYKLIKQQGTSFEEDNEQDSKIATALLVGIITDTDSLISDDTTEYEHSAYQQLFPFRDSTALKQIINYKLPREWAQAISKVSQNLQDRLVDGVLIHGTGFISKNNRDLIAAVADQMLTYEGVETAVAFAVIDGDRIEGSIRSSNPAITVATLCKALGEKCGGDGGGKLGKGAYSYKLGACGIDDSEIDDSTKTKFWEFLVDRETKRIIRHLKK